MTNHFQGYRRKSFPVTAARVDPTNIEELAEACGGQIFHDGEKEGNFSRDYIKVRVQYPMNEDQTKAHIGDWLVKQGGKFKVYKDRSFRNTFELPDGGVVPGTQPKKSNFVPKHHKPSPASMPKHIEGTQGPEVLSEDEIARLEHISNGGTPELEITSETVEVPVVNPEPQSAMSDDAHVLPVSDVAPTEVEETIEQAPAEGEVAQTAPEEAEFQGHEIQDQEAENLVSTPEEPKQSITLDELNERPGDPRSAQEIMNER